MRWVLDMAQTMITYAQSIHDGAHPLAAPVGVIMQALAKAVEQRKAGEHESIIFADLAYACALDGFDCQEVGMLAYAMLNKYMKDNHAGKLI